MQWSFVPNKIKNRYVTGKIPVTKWTLLLGNTKNEKQNNQNGFPGSHFELLLLTTERKLIHYQIVKILINSLLALIIWIKIC